MRNQATSLHITLSANGQLSIELPGVNGMRRKVPLAAQSVFQETLAEVVSFLSQASGEEAKKLRSKVELLQKRDGTLQETLTTILQAQLLNETEFDEDGNPSEHQIRHWERHSIWADPSCPFCISEGRMKPVHANKPKLCQRTLAEIGLTCRGYKIVGSKATAHNQPSIALVGGETIGSKVSVSDERVGRWGPNRLENLLDQGIKQAIRQGLWQEEPRKPANQKKAERKKKLDEHTVGNGKVVVRKVVKETSSTKGKGKGKMPSPLEITRMFNAIDFDAI